MQIEKKLKYGYNDGGIVFLLAIVLPIFISVILIPILLSFVSKDSIVYLLYCYLINQIIFALIFFIYNKVKNINFIKASKLKSPHSLKKSFLLAGICAVVGVICVFGLNDFISLFDKLIALTGYVAEQSHLLPFDNLGWLVLNVFILAVMPAIFEELLFRGIILNSLASKYKKWTTILLSALLFALFHQNISQTIYQFILGVVLGYVAYETGSVIYSMIVHFVSNFTVVVSYYIAGESTIVFNATFIILAIVLAIATFAVLIGIAFLIKKLCKNKTTQDAENINFSQDVVVNKPKVSIYYICAILIAGFMWIYDLVYGLIK